MSYSQQLADVLARAKAAAIDYYHLTQKPLGITGELGEFTAAQLLGLKLAEARTPGYDAIDPVTNHRIQIKSRLVNAPARLSGQRMGAIRTDHHDWDTVMLVIMHGPFEPYAIYEATAQQVRGLLTKTTSRARQRGALGVGEFIKVATCRWRANPMLELSPLSAR
jgi:hypothetical protein